jgi:negative regulator of flagellin synthesis FlgM
MKIGPPPPDGIRVDGIKPVGGERAPTAPAAGGVARTGGSIPGAEVDRVSLSGGASLRTAPVDTPFDQRKVDEVRRAIAEGRFPVDAKRVAEVLLAEARDLMGPGPQNR